MLDTLEQLLAEAVYRAPILVLELLLNLLAGGAAFWLMLVYVSGGSVSEPTIYFPQAGPLEVLSALCAGILALAVVNLLFRAIFRAYSWWRRNLTTL